MLNKVMLIGNLGQDVESKVTPSGTTVATLSVATSRTWKDKGGQKQEETEWHRVVVWDKAAEFCANYLHKGSKVYVEGRLATRKWQDQSGADRYTTEIIAQTVQISRRVTASSRQSRRGWADILEQASQYPSDMAKLHCHICHAIQVCESSATLRIQPGSVFMCRDCAESYGAKRETGEVWQYEGQDDVVDTLRKMFKMG